MINGVNIIDPENTYIGVDVIIGQDTIIYPNTHLQGSTVIGENCIIGPNSYILNTKIDDESIIESSKIINSQIKKACIIGPFSNIRENCLVNNNVKIGSYVELKNSKIGEYTQVPHINYIGDSEIGKNVEIACGTITANMNTKYEKNITKIKDNAFIGANSVLLAPVEIGRAHV